MSWPSHDGLEPMCARCKKLFPGHAKIAISHKWKRCIRCGTPTTYRLRPSDLQTKEPKVASP